jgi:hypothetical protein
MNEKSFKLNEEEVKKLKYLLEMDSQLEEEEKLKNIEEEKSDFEEMEEEEEDIEEVLEEEENKISSIDHYKIIKNSMIDKDDLYKIKNLNQFFHICDFFQSFIEKIEKIYKIKIS